MANTIFKSNIVQLNKAFHGLGLLCIIFLMHKACAREFQVGGSKGWSILPNNTLSYNQWAQNNRFQIEDSLLFMYPEDQDSVLQVTVDAYDNCDTDALPIDKFTDGHTSFTFNRSGAFYFISGNKDNCLKNEKLHVVVMGDRRNHSSSTNQTDHALSPPPSESMPMTPSPAPAGEEAPAPPTGTVEGINPAPAPSEEAHRPNAGSSMSFFSSTGAGGAFVAASSLLLVV